MLFHAFRSPFYPFSCALFRYEGYHKLPEGITVVGCWAHVRRKFDEALNRQESSKPVMEAFFAWADSCGAIPKSPVGKAAHYALSQRKYLERYLSDGRLEVSNNRAERSIKPFVIGRKNFLFANTPKSARASAVIFSVIETAKENGLDPYDYLTFIFERAPGLNFHEPEQLNKIMPDHFRSSARP